MAEIKSFPNNADEYISAEWPMRWLHGRTSGVFGENGGGAVAAVLDTMKVTVDDATGWMSNSNSDGICWFNDTYKSTGKKLELEIGAADGVLSRIDRVVVEWKTTTYADKPEIKILQGTASSNPTPPTLTNDNLKRQISLARVLVPAGSTSVSSANITDERLDPSVCGIVTDRVGVDTSMVNAQLNAFIEQSENELNTFVEQSENEFNTWFATVQDTLDSDTAGHLLNLINGKEDIPVVLSLTLAASGWTGSSSPYKQTVAIPGGTLKSKIDLQVDDTAAQQMLDDGTILIRVDNNNGTFVATAMGEKPTVDLTVQAIRSEVTS